MSKTLIALCGAPGAGKSTVQGYLVDHYGATAVDDGWPMRQFLVYHAGLTNWHVNTQAGKASFVTLPGGRLMQVRRALGELGNKIEELFGPQAIPAMAVHRALRLDAHVVVFGSVRRSQGHFYKMHGAKVIEIIRPGFKGHNEFDHYDPEVVDFTIDNAGSKEELFRQVDALTSKWPRLAKITP